MKRDVVSLTIGMVAGFVLGLLVKDEQKRRIQEMLTDNLEQMRKKCDHIQERGKELVHEGINKAKDFKREQLG
jgi:gas vesicle protein